MSRATLKVIKLIKLSRIEQEYPSNPLRKISALQTKVELAGNRNNKRNLAENLAYRELASWEAVIFGVQIAYILVLQISGWKLHSGCGSL